MRAARAAAAALSLFVASSCDREPAREESPISAELERLAGERSLPAPSRFVTPSELQLELQEAGQLDDIADVGPMSHLRFAALFARAEAAEERGDTAAAMAILEQLRLEAPPSAEVSFAMGRIEAHRNNLEAAATQFERATRIDADGLSAPLALSLVYTALDRPAEADAAALQVERRAHRLGELLVGDGTEDEKLDAVGALSVEVPNRHAARALVRALDTDIFRVRVAALEALESVAVPEATGPIRRALRDDPDSRYAPLYERVIAAVAQRETPP